MKQAFNKTSEPKIEHSPSVQSYFDFQSQGVTSHAHSPITPKHTTHEYRVGSHKKSDSNESGSNTFSPMHTEYTTSVKSPTESFSQTMSPFALNNASPIAELKWNSYANGAFEQPGKHDDEMFLSSKSSLGPLDQASFTSTWDQYSTKAFTAATSMPGPGLVNSISGETTSDTFGNRRASLTSPWNTTIFEPSAWAPDDMKSGRADLEGSADNRSLMNAQSFVIDAHRSQLENMRMQAHERFDDWVVKSEASKASASKFAERERKLKYAQLLGPQSHSATEVEDEVTNGRCTTPFESTAQSFTPFNNLSVDASDASPLATFKTHGFAGANSVPQALTSGNVWALHEAYDREYSVFVGDLCPDLREEDLVSQFRQPPAWPPSHPFAIAHAQAQQAQGSFGSPAKVAPAPFLSTKSATIMTDPLTGASRGFGFVRFVSEADCARALIEMQGVIVQPSSGHGGRPLRVCPATPKNRSSNHPSIATNSSGSTVQDRTASQATSTLPLNAHTTAELFARQSAQAISGPIVSAPLVGGIQGLDGSGSASSGAQDPGNTTVFVGGLSSLISEDTLKAFFVPFGEIKYVKIPPGKGCGFVQFVRKSDAERAIERMQGFPIGGGRIRLSWGRSQGDKAAAAAAQAAQHAANLGHLTGHTAFGTSSPVHFNASSLNVPGAFMTVNDTHSLLMKQLAATSSAGELKSDEAVAKPIDSALLSLSDASLGSLAAQKHFKQLNASLQTSMSAHAWQGQNHEQHVAALSTNEDRALTNMFSGLHVDEDGGRQANDSPFGKSVAGNDTSNSSSSRWDNHSMRNLGGSIDPTTFSASAARFPHSTLSSMNKGTTACKADVKDHHSSLMDSFNPFHDEASYVSTSNRGGMVQILPRRDFPALQSHTNDQSVQRDA